MATPKPDGFQAYIDARKAKGDEAKAKKKGAVKKAAKKKMVPDTDKDGK